MPCDTRQRHHKALALVLSFLLSSACNNLPRDDQADDHNKITPNDQVSYRKDTSRMDRRNASTDRQRIQRIQRIQPTDLDEIDMTVLLDKVCDLVEHYEDWIKVGTALKSWDFSRGFELWDQWSAQGSTYDPSIMRGKWKSFATGSVSFDFLISVALKNGWAYQRGCDAAKKPTTPPPQADPDTMPD